MRVDLGEPAKPLGVQQLHRPLQLGEVVLDSLEDPQNVGAILRTCDAAGATGVIRQSRHAARLDGAAASASAAGQASDAHKRPRALSA